MGLMLVAVPISGALVGPVSAQDLGSRVLLAPLESLRPEERPVAGFVVERPDARWDDHDQGAAWTEAVLRAMQTAPADLSAIVPRDIADWCPAYPSNPPGRRRAFWVGLISALVHHESYYNPRNVSGGGQWFGLMQIFPPTARGYGCDARSGDALLDPQANLTCAVQIMAQSVADWPSISVNNGRWRGVASQWGPMTQTRKRQDMQAWTNAQDYCQVSDRLALGPARLPLPALQ